MRPLTGSKRTIGWQHLLELAGSPNKDLRVTALIRGYAWVENALNAADAPDPNAIIAGRILRALGNPNLTTGLREKIVRDAISSRHRVAHRDNIPRPEEARRAIETYIQIWHALSRHFVNHASAFQLGLTLRKQPGIKAVALYGSLARGDKEPNDIDLLVLDDGRYSRQLHPSPYSDGRFDVVAATLEALRLIHVSTSKLQRCTQCRWLDIVVLHGDKFGIDSSYTKEVREAQPDPWFFLNIARDIKELDPGLGRYIEAARAPFAELRRTVRQLESMGLA